MEQQDAQLRIAYRRTLLRIADALNNYRLDFERNFIPVNRDSAHRYAVATVHLISELIEHSVLGRAPLQGFNDDLRFFDPSVWCGASPDRNRRSVMGMLANATRYVWRSIERDIDFDQHMSYWSAIDILEQAQRDVDNSGTYYFTWEN